METLIEKLEYKRIAELTYLINDPNGKCIALYNPLNMELILTNDLVRAKSYYEKPKSDIKIDQTNELYQRLSKLQMLPLDNYNNSNEIKEITRKVQSGLEVIYIIISWNCNLHCAYCHIHDENRNLSKKIINLNKMKKVLGSILASENIKEVVFYGGEPLIHRDIFIEIIDMLRHDFHYGNNVTLFTNGTLITESVSNALKKYCVFPIVSIDGDELVNDRNRFFANGKGCHEKIIDGVKELEAADIRYGFSLVISNNNYSDIIDSVTYLSNNFSPVDIGISTLHQKFGNPHDDYNILNISKEIVRLLENLQETGLYCEHVFRKLRPFIEKKIRINECPSCGYKILLAPEDEIGYCEAFFGTGLSTCSYSEFSYSQKEYTDWFNVNPYDHKDCISCPAISICGGGCPYDAYVSNGSIHQIDPIKCVFSRVVFEWIFTQIFSKFQLDADESYKVIDIDDRKFLAGKVDFNNIALPLRSYSELTEDQIIPERLDE